MTDSTSSKTESSVAVEHHIEVARTARYCTLGKPSGDVWIVLHGYKQLARRFLRRFSPIDDGTRLIVAPEGLSRFYVSQEPGRHGPQSVVGATWMTREDREHEIADYVRYLDTLADRLLTGTERLTILGFSQGVATASRWVVHGSVRPARVVLWGDFLPPDLDMAGASSAFADVELLLVRGSRDGALDPELASAERDRLVSAGLRGRRIAYEGGHDIDTETLLSFA